MNSETTPISSLLPPEALEWRESKGSVDINGTLEEGIAKAFNRMCRLGRSTDELERNSGNVDKEKHMEIFAKSGKSIIDVQGMMVEIGMMSNDASFYDAADKVCELGSGQERFCQVGGEKRFTGRKTSRSLVDDDDDVSGKRQRLGSLGNEDEDTSSNNDFRAAASSTNVATIPSPPYNAGVASMEWATIDKDWAALGLTKDEFANQIRAYKEIQATANDAEYALYIQQQQP